MNRRRQHEVYGFGARMPTRAPRWAAVVIVLFAVAVLTAVLPW